MTQLRPGIAAGRQHILKMDYLCLSATCSHLYPKVTLSCYAAKNPCCLAINSDGSKESHTMPWI